MGLTIPPKTTYNQAILFGKLCFKSSNHVHTPDVNVITCYSNNPFCRPWYELVSSHYSTFAQQFVSYEASSKYYLVGMLKLNSNV